MIATRWTSALVGLASLFTPATRLSLMTGFLGGYTTFSALAYDTVFLAREQAWATLGYAPDPAAD